MVFGDASENPLHFVLLRERKVVEMKRNPEASLISSVAQPSFRIAHDSGAVVRARPSEDGEKITEIDSGNVRCCFLHQTLCNPGFTKFFQHAPRFVQGDSKPGTAFRPDRLKR